MVDQIFMYQFLLLLCVVGLIWYEWVGLLSLVSQREKFQLPIRPTRQGTSGSHKHKHQHEQPGRQETIIQHINSAISPRNLATSMSANQWPEGEFGFEFEITPRGADDTALLRHMQSRTFKHSNRLFVTCACFSSSTVLIRRRIPR